MRQASVDRGECVSCAAKSVRVGETFGRETLLKSDFCLEKKHKIMYEKSTLSNKVQFIFQIECLWLEMRLKRESESLLST